MLSMVTWRKRGFSPAGAVCAGLLIAQVIATFHLWSANGKLSESLEHLRDAGYLTVPNELVAASLASPGSVFFGGLFFTLTLGAGLSLAGLAAAWLWTRFIGRGGVGIMIFAVVWTVAVVAVNSRGFTVWGTLYFVLIPPAVFALAANIPLSLGASASLEELIPLAPLLILAAVWIALLQGGSFAGIRDNLLGRNSAGMALAEFYYRYSPYPAHALKPLNMRIMKTCRFEGFREGDFRNSLESALLDRDWFPLFRDGAPVDLIIRRTGENELSLEAASGPVLKAEIGRFLLNPDLFLDDYAKRTDHRLPLRKALFLSLVLASPVFFYGALFSFFRGVLRLIFRGKEMTPVLLASAVCLVAGLGLLFLSTGNREPPPQEQLAPLLQSPRTADRVAALRALRRAGLDMGLVIDYGGYGGRIADMPALERYWLAAALSRTVSPAAGKDLLILADDALAGVSYRAYGALAGRGRRDAVPAMLERIGKNPFWYSQIYAYRALRSLGWKQELP